MDLKEAIQYLYTLKPLVEVKTVGDCNYRVNGSDLALLKPPLADAVSLKTLTGLVDLSQAGIDGFAPSGDGSLTSSFFVQVESHLKVNIIGLKADAYGQRRILATANAVVHQPFKFGEFHEPDKFIIGLLSGFNQTDELAALVSLCSSLTSESSAEAQDDGITQNIVVKSGAALKKATTTKPRVTLEPFRTFSEVDQPASDFLFRVRKGDEGQPPECALFEADGGKWQSTAIVNIKAYLQDELPLKVVA